MANEKDMIKLFTDPVRWAEAFLRDPRDRDKPLKLRSYQKEVLENTRQYNNMVLRWGRRMGKSVILCADTLFSATALPLARMIERGESKQKPIKILIATPYETQIKMLWQTYLALIADSPLLKQQIKKVRTSDVHVLEFDNGSVIEGYTIGISSSNQGTSLRGMCLSGETNVKLVDGSNKKLKNIKLNDKVLSFNEKSNTFEEDNVSYIFEKQNKELFEITFQSGKKIQASKDHKFLTNDGWKTLSNININDLIKTSFMSIPKKNNDNISDDYVILAANLIGDGSTTDSKIKSSTITFTNTDKVMLKKHSEVLTNLGFYYHIHKKKIKDNRKDAWDIKVTGIKRKQPEFFEFLEKFNLIGKNNTNKTISNLIKSLDLSKKALFIRHLFSTDGWTSVFKNGKYDQLEIGYSSNSYDLCCDIQEILSEFGVYSCIQTKKHIRKNEYVDGYQLKIRSKKNINLFFDKIGYIYSKEDQCKKVHDISKIGLSSDKINPIFDKVINIKSIGMQDCYDITVNKNHNFIANGLVVHNSADILFLDEMDAIPDEICTSVLMPIWTSHKDCMLRVSSTPMGKRGLFYKWCTESEDLGWYHRHYPSWHPDNDNWLSIEKAKEQGIPIQQSTEFQVKAVTPSDVYDREYGAEFGEELGGVYKHQFINRSIAKYCRNMNLEDPDIFDPGFEQNPSHKYIIGVDWNSYLNGGQVVLLEYCTTPTLVSYFDDEKQSDIVIDFTNKYRLFYRRGIKSKDSTQRQTRQEVIRLMTYYKIDYVYVDYGAGDTNVEELTFYGRNHPELKMHDKLRVIDSGAVVDHYDHIVGKIVKKRNKSLMVNFSVVSLEEGSIILPKEEDQATRLIGQMREYQIKNITSRGEYSYEGEDHILDAFNLAMYGFQQNYGSSLHSFIKQGIISLDDPRISVYPRRNQNSSNSPMYVNRLNHDPETERSFDKPSRVTTPNINSRSNINFRRGSAFSRTGF